MFKSKNQRLEKRLKLADWLQIGSSWILSERSFPFPITVEFEHAFDHRKKQFQKALCTNNCSKSVLKTLQQHPQMR